MDIVTLFNNIRAQSEGNVGEAMKLAKAAGLPSVVCEYLALSTDWRNFETSFRAACDALTKDESVAKFWRAAAFESLGTTTPADQTERRIYLLDSAAEMADDLADIGEPLAQLYIETCVSAGKNEMPGRTPELEVMSQAAAICVTQGWFNAPGQLKAYCDQLVKVQGNAASASDLIATFAKFETEGGHSFSPRQTSYLKGAHSTLFPSPTAS